LGIAAETRIIPASYQSANTRVLYMMAAALGRRDTYTHAHAQRVAAYSRRLSIRLSVTPQQLYNFTMGGMLHDVGKIALSDRIFSSKQASLSKKLLGEVKSHPLIGAAMLRHTQCHRDIAEMVLFHHERIDGSGYPFGLTDEEIPLGAKIVSIADCFDAITTDRPYQRRKTLPHAFNILMEMAGKCLDEPMVRMMIQDIETNGTEPLTPAASASIPLY